jgi:MerR family copper efflux transcriptional regulator
MRIGEVATKSEVSVQTLRYYERRGLLPPQSRKASGYRRYDAEAILRVRFIRRAQDLGFTLEEIGDLLQLWSDSAKSCKAVEHRAATTLSRIDDKIHQLEKMRDGLAHYVTACHNRDSIDECPLLGALGGSSE